VGVVRGRRRHVAHHHRVEVADVDAQLHRGRAVQQLQLRLAERLLALAALVRVDLRGVFAGDEAAEIRGGVPVQVPEEDVDTGAIAAGVGAGEGVVGADLARPGAPDQACRRDAVAGDRLTGGTAAAPGPSGRHRDLLDQVRLGQNLKQLLDEQLGVIDRQVVEMHAPQVLAELVEPGQEQTRTVQAGTGLLRVRRADTGLIALRQHPRVDESLLAGTTQAVEVVPEVLHIDREVTAHLVHQRTHDLRAAARLGVAQRTMCLLPAVLLAGHPVEILVVDPQQTCLLQVRHGDAPAALQVQIETERDYVPQRPRRVAGHRRRQVRGAGVVGDVQAEDADNPGRQILVADALLTRLHGRPVQRPSKLGDLHEVVEVARLERGILPVVDEREQLACLGAQRLLRHRPQETDDRRRHQRRCRGTSLLVERRQLGEVPAADLLIAHPAVQAEPERRRNERGLKLPLALDAVRIDADRDRELRPVVRAHDLLPSLVHLQPRFRQPPTVDRLFGRPRPRPARIHVQIAVALTAARRRGVTARFVPDHAVLVRAPHGQILLAAFSAERQRKEDLAARPRLDELVIAGALACVRVLQGDVDRVALGQELVQTEREQRTLGHRMPGLRTGLQGAADRLNAHVFGDAGLLSKVGGGLLDLRGLLADETSRRVFDETESRLDPARQRISHQVVIRARGTGRPEPLRRDRVRRLTRGAHQCLADDVVLVDLDPEEGRGHAGNLFLLVLEGALARHRRRRADALQVLRLARLAHPADE